METHAIPVSPTSGRPSGSGGLAVLCHVMIFPFKEAQTRTCAFPIYSLRPCTGGAKPGSLQSVLAGAAVSGAGVSRGRFRAHEPKERKIAQFEHRSFKLVQVRVGEWGGAPQVRGKNARRGCENCGGRI